LVADAVTVIGSGVAPDDLTASHHRVGGVAANPTMETAVSVVIPAEAGIQVCSHSHFGERGDMHRTWIPACAGMTS